MSVRKDTMVVIPSARPAVPIDRVEPGAPALRPVYGRSGAVAVVTCGLAAVVALFTLPLVYAPARRTASWFALVGAVGDERRLMLIALVALASVGIVVVGGWMLASDANIRARRHGAVAVAVFAVVAIVSGLVVFGSAAEAPDDSGTSAPLGPAASLDAGSWLVLAGLVGAVVGSLVEVIGAGPAATRKARLAHGVVYVLLAVFFGTTSVVVAYTGPRWSGGVWSGNSAEITTSATCVSENSREQDKTPTDFDPRNTVDRRPDTAWRCDGDGVGQRLHIDLGEVRTIRVISMLPGYGKIDLTDETNRYAQNRRIYRIRITFDDGTSKDHAFDTNPELYQSLQAITVQPVQTRSVTVTILESVEGNAVRSAHARENEPPDQPPRDFAPISEIRFA